MAISHQLVLSLLVTSSVWAQNGDRSRPFYDLRRGPEQGGMQYYYLPQSAYFHGRQQEMNYAQDPFFGYNGELPLPFSQDIFKPIPARKPAQSAPDEGAAQGSYSDHRPDPDNDQAPYYIIPTGIEFPEQVVPVPVSPNPPNPPPPEVVPITPEPVESSGNSTEAILESTDQPEEGNTTNAESQEVSVPTPSPDAGSSLNLRKTPMKKSPYFTNAHHFPFPMGMKNEYKLQYQAMFPDAPMPQEQETFTPLEAYGGIPNKPNQFMWLNPYSKKPSDSPAFMDYDPSMLINPQQQAEQQKPQFVYYFFRPPGSIIEQPQAEAPSVPDQQQTSGFVSQQQSSPVYMLFQPSNEDSFNVAPQSENKPPLPPPGSISGRGGQNGQYVEVPLSFMSNPAPQQESRFYYVRPEGNRFFNDRV